MPIAYPNLTGEIAKRGIKKNAIANHIGISYRAFYSKLSGQVSFTWDEAFAIKSQFFPDLDIQQLFSRSDQETA